MEVTEKKILANRENGKKGGVKTSEGKDITRFNSLKHGIMAKFSTKYDDLSFEQVFEMFKQEINPETAIETILLEQLTVTYIRLRRCARFDSEIIREALNPPKYEDLLEDVSFKKLVADGEPALIELVNFSKLELVITKYEPILFNRLMKILDRLAR